MKCLTVRILGATGTILKTDPEIQMFIQILQIGIQIQQQQRRVSVFSGARGRGAGKGVWLLKLPLLLELLVKDTLPFTEHNHITEDQWTETEVSWNFTSD